MFEVGRGALSRATRDGGAGVEVCPRCGTREGLYGYDPERQPLLTDWPLSPELLAGEELRLISWFQQAHMSVGTITPQRAERMLDEKGGGEADDGD
jgi:hypothetical protein